MSFERRFSAIGKGLPGVVGFDLRDLSDGDMPRWNSTTEKWELAQVYTTDQVYTQDEVDNLIQDHLEANISGAQSAGDVIYWDGTDWTDTGAISIDPAGAVELSHDGIKAAATTSAGLLVQDTSGSVPLLRFNDDTGTALGQINASTTGVFFQSQVHGGVAGLQAEDSGGTNRNIVRGDADGAVNLYYAGSKKLETTSTGITVTGSVHETSDSRLKSDRAPISGALNAVLSLRGETYEMSGRRASGLIAQDIRRHMPEAASSTMYQDGDDGESEEVLTYSPSAVLAYVIEALREIDQRTKALEERDTRENSQ